jgi:hypothetical protein
VSAPGAADVTGPSVVTASRVRKRRSRGEDEASLSVPDHLNGQPWGTPLALAALWNEISPPECLNVVALTPARIEKARKYLKMFPDQPWWREAFAEVALSRFLRGLDNNPNGGHKNFRATFDWFLQRGQDNTENCVKAYEGRYRDGR